MNKWTDDEKKYVIKKYKEGYTPEEIHKTGKINRSKYAIELKIYNQIYDQLQNGDTHDDITKEYKKSTQEIKEIEKKIFEMKNKSDHQTPYTNDGGYVYNPTPLDFSEYHHVNRIMNTILHFYENINRLNKLKEDNIIDDAFYNALVQKLDKINIDKDKVINSLETTISQINTHSNTQPNTHSNTQSNTENNSDQPDKLATKKEKSEKKITKKKNESDDDASVEIEIPVKKLKKRLI